MDYVFRVRSSSHSSRSAQSIGENKRGIDSSCENCFRKLGRLVQPSRLRLGLQGQPGKVQGFKPRVHF